MENIASSLDADEIELILELGPRKCVQVSPQNERLLFKLIQKNILYKPFATIDFCGLTEYGKVVFQQLNFPDFKF